MDLTAIWLTGAIATAVSSPFDGTWRTEAASLRATVPPIVFEMRAGVFTCRSCRPPYTLKADGQFHTVVGRADTDASMMAAPDKRHFTKVDRLHGHDTVREVFSLGADGRSAELDLTDVKPAGEPSVTTRQRLIRISGDAVGVTGAWRVDPASLKRNALSETLKVENGALQTTTPDGRSSLSRLDGRVAPVQGRPGVDSTSVRRDSDRVLTQTDFYKDRPVTQYRMTVSPGGREMLFEEADISTGSKSTQVLRKQQN